MYGRGGGLTSVIASGTVAGAGIITLPNTSGLSIGRVLAYTAIAIGLVALVSQIGVFILRRIYRTGL
jgi:hypothetical protein